MLTARFESFTINRQKFRSTVEENCLVRIVFFHVTERNFAVNEKWLTARFESLYYKQTEISQLTKNS